MEATGLVKKYGDVVALAGLDLAVAEGTVLGLLGPNGAGKTTAVSILTTLLKPDSGSATVAGADVIRNPEEVRKLIGLSGQYAAVDEALTGYENLDMIGRLYHLGRARSRERARELLERFDLADAADRPVKTYSGGMRRRLDLAGALVAESRVLFLDEPTTGLDPRSRVELWAIIRDLVYRGRTLLLTTQYLEEADRLADRITVVDRGRVIAEGTAHQLKERVGGAAIAVVAADRADLAAIGEVVAHVAGTPPVVDAGAGRVTAPVADDLAVLAGVAGELRERSVEVADIGLHRPSLDDVFLALTGQAPVHDTGADENADALEVRS